MKYFQQFTFIFIFCLLHYNLFSQSIITNEQQAMGYFDQKFFSLDKLEGIYNVDISFQRPKSLCERCEYKEYVLYNYDKVAIYRSNGRIYHYSIKKGKITGTFVSINDFLDIYSFIIQGINDQVRLSELTLDNIILKDDHFEISSNAKIDKVRNYFGYESTRNLNIKCKGSDDPLLESLEEVTCYDYDVHFKYNKSFPPKDYTPQPQYEYGTGFVISPKESLILTNYHVVRDYQNNFR